MLTIIKNNFKLFSLSQYKKAFYVLLLMLFGMLFEMLGVGLIVPVLSIITTSDIVAKYPEVESLYDAVGNPSKPELITWIMLLLAAVYFIKSVFLSFLSWVEYKFVANIRMAYSEELYNGYLLKPYIFHLRKNSAELIRNVSGDVGSYSKSLSLTLKLFLNIINFVGVLILLFWLEFFGTVVITLLLGVFFVVFFLLLKKKMSYLGTAIRYYSKENTLHLLQGLNGIKDVKVLGREDFFQRNFNNSFKSIMALDVKRQFITSLPGFWFEFIAIVGLVSLILSLLAQGKAIENLVPMVGLFAIAAFRLMPASVRIFTSMQQLRLLSPSVEGLTEEIEDIRMEKVFTEKTNSMETFSDWSRLKIEGLTYTYDSESIKQNVLNNIELNIKAGQAIGVIGASGSGKSTLIDLILGVLNVKQGSIAVDGVNIANNIRAWQNKIGYVPQSIYLTDDTLRRNVAFGIPDEKINEKDLERAICSAQLEEVVNNLDLGLDTLVGENGVKLSGGQRQRIGIARALYHNPLLVVLDEATSALDEGTEKEVMRAVNSLKGEKTLIIIAHRLSTVAKCDKLFLLDDGMVTQSGTVDNVIKYMASQ